MTSTLRAFAMAIIGGVAIAVSVSGIAWAVTSNVFQYSTEKTGWLMLPPSAFAPDAGAGSAWAKSGGMIQGTALGTPVCLSAPINLPQGAKLVAVAVWYARSDSGALSYLLQRRDGPYQFGVGVNIVDRTAPSTDSATRLVSHNITDPGVQTVDNRSYVYSFQVCLDGGGALAAVRITYRYTNAGD